MTKTKLDVGCGCHPTGDVNCDLYIEDSHNHRGFSFKPIPKNTANFVLCDGSHLPFKDNVFIEVFSAQVIEHLENPLAFLKELSRVASNTIQVETAHYRSELLQWRPKFRRWNREHHISKMNFKWLMKAGRALGLQADDPYIKAMAYFPHRFLPWVVLPAEIGICYHKK